MAALIGIDIGTTSVKAVMCDSDGRRLAAFAADYPTARPGPGRVEQDPTDWWRLTLAALERFAATGEAVAAICVTSQVNTHLFCDADLTPLAPAMVWSDGRAGAAGAMLDARIPSGDKTAALGAPIPIDASHALSRMAWMAAELPDLWAATEYVLLPKDWIAARLTGRVAGDPISAVGLVGPDHAYSAPILTLVDRAAQVLPPLCDPLDVLGPVTDGPFAGVPLVTGTMDAWASMFGTGVAEEGQAMLLSGTSDVLGLVSAAGAGAPGIVSFPPWRGIRLHAAPTQSGGASLAWLGRLLGQVVEDLPPPAPITPGAPLFLPHLEGERAPLWDPDLRGTFAGLTGGTNAAVLVAAVMEGVAFSARLAVEALECAGGRPVAELQAGGGGTASDAWCRIRADALGRPLVRMRARDAGAVGAMVMAGVGAGLLPDLGAASGRLVPEDRRFAPDPALAERANARYALWQDLHEATRGISHALAGARA